MRRTRCKCSPAARLGFFAGSLLLGAPVQAGEYGYGDNLLGYSIPMAGYTPLPGVYFLNTFYLYSGSANVNAEFPIGRITAVGLTEHFAVNITTTAWYTDMTILGGTLGFAATIPFGSDTNTAAVSFIGPLGFGRQVNRTDTVTAIGDTAFSASLGWQQGEHHWNMTLTGVAPTGGYNAGSLAIMGLNRPAVDLKGAYTFLSLETGIEATGALGFTFNAMNTATDYQTGIEMHFEWELAEHLPFGLAAGVGGYLYQQLTGDSGSSAVLGPFIGRVASVGPVLSYHIQVWRAAGHSQRAMVS